MRTKFALGDEVRVIRAIRNDGTMYGYATGELLVRRGSTGFVRSCGTFLLDQIIYQVHFLNSDMIVGCREQEIISATAAWHAGHFQYGDSVICRHTLTVEGKVAVRSGARGRIERTDQGEHGEIYTVMFGERWFQVPASAIKLLEE
ncbi:nitrogen fixation protein NifZ [Pantoea sp. At-9b]|uniref:nitrogen fixation protein NifZ n=1 Tax=Pantoea sp. (strain At-9b) TaxID=592316 RepID=UPI0001B400B0|nr:nitrogen fixation protein NifZ [Pantoea sp. At-9b]ACU32742.1 nitrogen fixation protein [Pantoea sp. At-9b]ADU72677.1 NifZ family protein [Pantoea sp. At-9b]